MLWWLDGVTSNGAKRSNQEKQIDKQNDDIESNVLTRDCKDFR